MRDLLYVSGAKIAQLAPSSSRRIHGFRFEEVKVKAPFGEAGVKFGAGREDSNDLVRSLETVEARLLSDYYPRWFEEEELRPGDWVQFVAQLDFEDVRNTGGLNGSPPVVLFWTGPRSTRLVLHGSAEHMVSTRGRSADGLTCMGGSRPPDFVRIVKKFQSSASDDSDLMSSLSERSAGMFARSLQVMLRRLDRVDNDMSAFMSGFARVTCIVEIDLSRVVVASPLVVEYASREEVDNV